MAASSSGVFDFNGDNTEQWRGLLQQALRKIQKQVHPRLDIDEDAVTYLEGLIYCLLAQMCAAKPHSIPDVEVYVQKNFMAPIDTWALSDAQLLMDRAQKRKGVFIFPVDKLFVQLQKEVFGYKIEFNLVQFIMAILDYVSADILKLAGNFVKNTRKPAVIIQSSDIKVSMSADPALQALIQPLQGGQAQKDLHIENYTQESTEGKSLTYDELLRQLIDEESQFVRHLNLILKVFMEPFSDRRLFPTRDVERIFGNLTELHELSVKLLSDLDDCIEMSGEIGGQSSVPQAGIIFEDLAESYELEIYTRYAENYIEAKCALEELLADQEIVRHFKSSKTKLFKEAMQYILPNSLLEPVYHFFYYFEVMEALFQCSPTPDDYEAFESAITCTLGTKMETERVCSRFLPKRKEDTGMFGKGQGYGVALRKVGQIQQKIEGWEGPDILSCCTKLIKEGSLNVIKDSGRRAQKTERHVFLLDGLAICCKPKGRGSIGEYRFKEKINMRKAELIDLEDADDLKYAFQLMGQDQPAITFYAISKLEKNEWMAALTLLLTRSTFDRLLDNKLSEEERNIAVLTPDPNQYIFAEEDSDGNILFDEVEVGKPSGGPGPPIKAGTINKLVERLTFHEYADPSFVRTFLMTYRSFSEPHELLDLLVARFQIPMPIDMDNVDVRRDPNIIKAIKRYKATYVSPIQLRVLNVLRHWVEYHYYDFVRHPKLLEKLHNFVASVKTKNMQKWVLSINRALQKKEAEKPSAHKQHIFSSKAEDIEWHIARTKDKYHLLTLHPVEIARQLTLIQSEYFRAIHPSELVDASWMKDEKKEKASPNLLKLNRFETTISNWLAKEIVTMENMEERVALVSRLVDIMDVLLNLNNFAGMFVINAAFESASVYRLKNTFKTLHHNHKKKLEEMKPITSSYMGYKCYKEKLRTINPPCVPFLGMYMSWIVFMKDGNEDKILGKADQFINFKKRRKIADVCQEIQQYQNSPYHINQEQSIQDWILSHDPVGNTPQNQWQDEMFELSRSIEPKDQPPIKVPRQYRFDLRPPGSGFGTFRTRNRHKPANPSSLPQDDQSPETDSVGGEPSPGPGSTPPQSPRFFENGVASPGKVPGGSAMMASRSRATSTPGDTPPRPPRLPPKNPSMSSIPVPPPPIPDRASSHSPPMGLMAGAGAGGGAGFRMMPPTYPLPPPGPKPPPVERKQSAEKRMLPIPPPTMPDNDIALERSRGGGPPPLQPKPSRPSHNNSSNNLKLPAPPPPSGGGGGGGPTPDVPPQLPPRSAPPIPKRSAIKQVPPPIPPRE